MSRVPDLRASYGKVKADLEEYKQQMKNISSLVSNLGEEKAIISSVLSSYLKRKIKKFTKPLPAEIELLEILGNLQKRYPSISQTVIFDVLFAETLIEVTKALTAGGIHREDDFDQVLRYKQAASLSRVKNDLGIRTDPFPFSF